MPAGFGRSFRIFAGSLASVFAFTAISPTHSLRFVERANAQVPAPGPAQEQIDFDAALEGYGHWVEHPRLGEVWVPDNVPQDWQPYRIGHWVYTDEWGWYWNSDEDFGWVTYHYGRWYLDRELGWVWIPKDEWGPAWVNWRQGDDFVGWAPTPPDEYADNDEEYADSYMFVRAGDLLAPEVYTVFIPYRERRDYYRRSLLVNRTIIFTDRRGAVNPGIPPAFIAHASGRPFHSSHVAPIVLAGTIGVAGAVILRNGFRDRSRTRVSVRESTRVIEPSGQWQRLPGLNKGERGRLGNNAPRGAQGGNAVLQLNAQGSGQDRRYRHQKNDAQNFGQKKIEERKIESKQIEQKNSQQKGLEQKKIQQKNLQQQNTQPQNTQQKNLQQKSINNTQQAPGERDRRRIEDSNRKNIERKNFEQKSIQKKEIQQKNIPQNSQMQKNMGGSNNPPSHVQQNQQQQRQMQQNQQQPRQNFQQQQHTAPKPQSAPRPQQNNRSNEKDKRSQ